jgi:hypothetical protein
VNQELGTLDPTIPIPFFLFYSVQAGKIKDQGADREDSLKYSTSQYPIERLGQSEHIAEVILFPS